MAVVSGMDVFCVDHGTSLRWTETAPVCCLTTTILRVVDGDGAEGIAGYDSYMPAPSDRSVLEALRSLAPALIGRDTGAREALAHDLRVAVVFPILDRAACAHGHRAVGPRGETRRRIRSPTCSARRGARASPRTRR